MRRIKIDASPSMHPINTKVTDVETGTEIRYIQRIELVIDARRDHQWENMCRLYVLPQHIQAVLDGHAEVIDMQGTDAERYFNKLRGVREYQALAHLEKEVTALSDDEEKEKEE